MKKVILTIIICIFAISGIILVIMYNMGDRLIEEAIRSDLLLAENTVEDQTDEGTKGTESLQEQQQTDNNLQPAVETNASNPTESNVSNEAVAAPSGAAESTGAGNKNKADKPASRVPKKKKPETQAKTALIDAELNAIKDGVSASDKITAAVLAFRRLSSSDISTLKGMLAGGLSEEELAQAKALAYARFTKDEIAQIKEMYARYMK